MNNTRLYILYKPKEWHSHHFRAYGVWENVGNELSLHAWKSSCGGSMSYPQCPITARTLS